MTTHRPTRSGHAAPGLLFRCLAGAAAFAILLIAGGGAGILAAHGREPRFERLLADQAIARLQADLDHPGERIAFFGDSHAAFLARAGDICGAPPLDAGIGGITASDYLALIRDRLTFPRPIGTAVLSVGTNDARRKVQGHDVAEFRQDASALVAALSAAVGRLYVVAPPPLGLEAASQYDLAALGRYTAVLAEICRSARCTFIDPYAKIRGDDPFVAIAGIMSADGVHLADYRPTSRAIGEAVCR